MAPAAAAATDAPAVSEEKKKEAEGEALKMLEFYFGDSNFGWDRFMQSKVTAVWTGARCYDRSGMLDSLARGGTRVCAFYLVCIVHTSRFTNESRQPVAGKESHKRILECRDPLIRVFKAYSTTAVCVSTCVFFVRVFVSSRFLSSFLLSSCANCTLLIRMVGLFFSSFV